MNIPLLYLSNEYNDFSDSFVSVPLIQISPPLTFTVPASFIYKLPSATIPFDDAAYRLMSFTSAEIP